MNSSSIAASENDVKSSLPTHNGGFEQPTTSCPLWKSIPTELQERKHQQDHSEMLKPVTGERLKEAASDRNTHMNTQNQNAQTAKSVPQGLGSRSERPKP